MLIIEVYELKLDIANNSLTRIRKGHCVREVETSKGCHVLTVTVSAHLDGHVVNSFSNIFRPREVRERVLVETNSVFCTALAKGILTNCNSSGQVTSSSSESFINYSVSVIDIVALNSEKEVEINP